MKLIHLHIPKTAGTSLRESIQMAHPELNVQQVIDPIPSPLPDGTDIISGHISYDDAIAHGNQIVTVLRHPVDRFVSIYFFWRELYAKGIERTRKTSLAHHLSLLEFARSMDEPELTSELFNRMSWQVHSNYRLMKRFERRRSQQITQDSLTQGALDNLRQFPVVGFQDRYGDFVEALNAHFDLKIVNRKINVTASRGTLQDLSRDEFRAILNWVEADMDIYQTILKERG